MTPLNQSFFVSRALRDVDLPQRLGEVLGLLHDAFWNTQDQRFAYDRAASAQSYRDLVTVVRALGKFDPASLRPQAARKAFWLNLYNALTLHAVIDGGLFGSVRDDKQFYTHNAYVVGGQIFHLDDIEHGVLRGNAAKYSALGALGPLWRSDDPRLALAADPDPLIHFGLYAATRSSPELCAFSASTVDTQLRDAARTYLQREVYWDRTRDLVELPMLFKWYARDFEPAGGALHFVRAYVGDPAVEDWLAQHSEQKLRYADYRWALNGAPAQRMPPGTW